MWSNTQQSTGEKVAAAPFPFKPPETRGIAPSSKTGGDDKCSEAQKSSCGWPFGPIAPQATSAPSTSQWFATPATHETGGNGESAAGSSTRATELSPSTWANPPSTHFHFGKGKEKGPWSPSSIDTPASSSRDSQSTPSSPPQFSSSTSSQATPGTPKNVVSSSSTPSTCTREAPLPSTRATAPRIIRKVRRPAKANGNSEKSAHTSDSKENNEGLTPGSESVQVPANSDRAVRKARRPAHPVQRQYWEQLKPRDVKTLNTFMWEAQDTANLAARKEVDDPKHLMQEIFVLKQIIRFQHQQFQRIAGNNEDCSICLSEFVPEEQGIARLKCGHTFHLSCAGCSFNAANSMVWPMCRDCESSDWKKFSQRRDESDDDNDDDDDGGREFENVQLLRAFGHVRVG